MTAQPVTAYADAANTWNRRFRSPAFVCGTEPNAWSRGGAESQGGAFP